MSQADPRQRFGYRFGRFEFAPDRRLLSRDGSPVRIGSRAMDILQVFLERPGTPITTEALIAAVWKNRFVEKGSVKVNVAALRKLLGKTSDGSQYIITEPGRGYVFVADVVTPESDALSREETARCLNFPARLVPVIGREGLLARLSLQNTRGRLLTITGPGGIGKTTVGVALAERVAREYADGATYLDLAPLNNPTLVSATIAAQMGLLIRSADPIDDVVAHLRHRRSLLLMDNCEHLVDALSHVIEKLLSNAPLVDIVATSREPLLISAEKVEKIGPLTSPPDDVSLSPETAMSASAIRLFVARAQATMSDFLLTTDNVDLVTSICRRLDGLPLAIELAAALLASLSLEEIQVKIGTHFHELTLGYRTAPQRHQSLHNLLEWSYGLLSPAEKKALVELSIFCRSFVLDSAVELLQLDSSSAIGLLTSLVRKSLIVCNDAESPRSYRMLETTRAFATQKLNQDGRRDEIVRRHAEHIIDLFGLYDPAGSGVYRKFLTRPFG